jgi:hypothetical protein
MPILPERTAKRPRLAPELDDADLGRLLQQLSKPGGMRRALDVALISSLLDRTGNDWDRRSHRISTLARFLAETETASSWLIREPHSADALVFSSWVDLVRGLRARRFGNTSQLVSNCRQAADLKPGDPLPWVVLLGVARIERHDRGTVFSIWREATGRDHWNREAYLQLLGYLSPHEGGSTAQVLDFIDTSRPRIPANAPCAAAELTAYVRQYQGLVGQGGVRALTAGELWESGPVTAALNKAGSMWVKPGFLGHAAALADLNVLAYALCAARRTADADQAFQLLRGRVTHWPWRFDGDAVNQFTHHRARAAAAVGRRRTNGHR